MSLQMLNELMRVKTEASRARDMAVGDTTQKMDKFTVFTGLVFPDNPAPGELASTKTLVGRWLVWALSGRPHPGLAMWIHNEIRGVESHQARWVGVPEAKYIDSGECGYPLAALGQETDMESIGGGLNAEAQRIQEAKKDSDDKRGGKTG